MTMLNRFFRNDISRILPVSLVMFAILSSVSIGAMFEYRLKDDVVSRLDTNNLYSSDTNSGALNSWVSPVLERIRLSFQPNSLVAKDNFPLSRTELIYGSSHEWDSSLYHPDYRVENLVTESFKNNAIAGCFFLLIGLLVYFLLRPYSREHIHELAVLEECTNNLSPDDLQMNANDSGQLFKIGHNFFQAIEQLEKKFEVEKSLWFENSSHLSRVAKTIRREVDALPPSVSNASLGTAIGHLDRLSKAMVILGKNEKTDQYIDLAPTNLLETLNDLKLAYPELDVLGTNIILGVDVPLFKHMIRCMVNYAEKSVGTPKEMELVQSNSVVQVSIINCITKQDNVVPYVTKRCDADKGTTIEPRYTEPNLVMASAIAKAHGGGVTITQAPYPVITVSLPIV